jgi:hypothetical protein
LSALLLRFVRRVVVDGFSNTAAGDIRVLESASRSNTGPLSAAAITMPTPEENRLR